MRLRELESVLTRVGTFENPKIELEQYPTSAHLAARMLHVAEETYGDISDCIVGDLGCGGGILGIGAGVLGADLVYGVDCDAEILPVAAANAAELEIELELICANVSDLSSGPALLRGADGRPFETVVMNPPFGTRMKGADMMFVKSALEVCSGAVYSLHKSSTRDHIMKKSREWSVGAAVVAQMRFDIPQMYKFHASRTKDIHVDFWRFTS